MRNYDEQKRFLHLAIVASLLIFLYELGKILNVSFVLEYNWTLLFLVSSFFIAILIVSMVRFVKEQHAPIIIQMAGALVTFLLMVSIDPVTDTYTETEKNFLTYKEGREEIVPLVLDGSIVKEQPHISNVGMFIVPWGYMDDLSPRDFSGKVYSEEKHFFFFRVDTSGYFDSLGVGTTEGFVYSSLNRPPTWQEFDAYGQMKHIEGPWYYVNSKPKNFEIDCPTLCNK